MVNYASLAPWYFNFSTDAQTAKTENFLSSWTVQLTS